MSNGLSARPRRKGASYDHRRREEREGVMDNSIFLTVIFAFYVVMTHIRRKRTNQCIAELKRQLAEARASAPATMEALR
jgi:hypothetical protein